MASEDHMTRQPLPGKMGRSPIIQRLLQRSGQIEDSLERQRSAMAAIISLLFAIMGFIGLLGLLVIAPGAIPRWLQAMTFAICLAYVVLYGAAQRGRSQMARWSVVAMTFLGSVLLGIVHPVLSPEMMALALVVSVATAAFLLQPEQAFATGLAAIVLFTVAVVTQESIDSNQVDISVVSIHLTQGVMMLGIIALIAWLLSSNMRDWAGQAQRRERQLEMAAVIGETAFSAASLHELLNAVVDRIRDAYSFYYVQIFLVDGDGQQAHLQAGTSRAGHALLRLRYALAIGGQSVIGQCIARGEPVVVNDVCTSSIYLPNDLLPHTRSELALPLMVGDEVIGALNVQSTEVDAFQPDDVRSLQMMMAQLAAAITKTQLVDELQTQAQENARLYEETQRTLQRIDDLNRRLTRKGWQDFAHHQRDVSQGCTLIDDSIQVSYDWTDAMRQAYQGAGHIVVRYDDDAHVVALPIRVHSETIGVVEVARDGERSWSEAEIELAATLIERLALALENARLYERATQAVEREQTVNQIAQDLQQAQSIDEVLQSALEQLSGVLGASHSVVQIGSERPSEMAAQQERGRHE